MKTLKLMMVSAILITMFSTSSCGSYNYVTTEQQTIYENPEWAPDYYSGVRYYYLPDLEVYYDLTMREFIYLNNGRWLYSRVLPPMYSYYDLNSGYVIVLNTNIYRPWMHHQYYVSHYPRYYYRDYYDRSNFAYVRGFNENVRSAIFWKENERHRAREWNDDNLKNNRRFKYSSEDRRQQNPYNENTRRISDNNRNSTGNTYDRNTKTPNDNVNRRKTENNGTSTRENNGNTRPAETDTPNTNRNSETNRNSTGNTYERNANTPNDNGNRRKTENNGTSTRENNGNTRPAETDTRDTNRNSETNRTGTTRTENTGAIQTNRSETNTIQQPNAPATGNDRRTQSTNYYGRTIGTSVKVEKQMRNPTPESTQGTSRSGSSTEGTPVNTRSNSTDQNNQRR
jgi:hypothetical protein